MTLLLEPREMAAAPATGWRLPGRAAALIDDDAAMRLVQALCALLGLDLQDAVDDAGAPAVVFVGIGAIRAMHVVDAIGTFRSTGSVVIAVGQDEAAARFRDALDAGAQDYWPLPIAPDFAAHRLHQLQRFAPSSSAAMRPAPHDTRRIGLIGAQGGVGTSTLALALACAATRRIGRRALLVDGEARTGWLRHALPYPEAHARDAKRPNVPRMLRVDEAVEAASVWSETATDVAILDLGRFEEAWVASWRAALDRLVLVTRPALADALVVRDLLPWLAITVGTLPVDIVVNHVAPLGSCALSAREWRRVTGQSPCAEIGFDRALPARLIADHHAPWRGVAGGAIGRHSRRLLRRLDPASSPSALDRWALLSWRR